MLRRLDPRADHRGLDYRPRDELPLGWRHPVTGRTYHRDDPALERLGVYLRRARYIAGRSQVSVAKAAGIPQSQYSRLERALAPAMNVERLCWIDEAFQGVFPLGYCPHDHVCRWSRLNPREQRAAQQAEDQARAAAMIELMFREAEEEPIVHQPPTEESAIDLDLYSSVVFPGREVKGNDTA